MAIIAESNENGVCIIELAHPNKHNPYNEQLENEIQAALLRANNDPNVIAIVVTGGENRSFSVGGDFNEVKNLIGGSDVDRWIDRVTALYASALNIDKPTIASIEGFAIGMGFQFAMMFDWRIMSETAELRMPELKYGIGCSVGCAILHHVVGYNNMREIIYNCENIDPQKALQYGLINEIFAPDVLLKKSIEIAQKLGNYPVTSFQNTKKVITKSLLNKLYETAEESKKVHKACFQQKSPQQHFKNILKEKYNQ